MLKSHTTLIVKYSQTLSFLHFSLLTALYGILCVVKSSWFCPLRIEISNPNGCSVGVHWWYLMWQFVDGNCFTYTWTWNSYSFWLSRLFMSSLFLFVAVSYSSVRLIWFLCRYKWQFCMKFIFLCKYSELHLVCMLKKRQSKIMLFWVHLKLISLIHPFIKNILRT